MVLCRFISSKEDMLCAFPGISEPNAALVESEALCLGARAFRNLGWGLHHLHDQHFRRGPVSPHWLAGGKCHSRVAPEQGPRCPISTGQWSVLIAPSICVCISSGGWE